MAGWVDEATKRRRGGWVKIDPLTAFGSSAADMASLSLGDEAMGGIAAARAAIDGEDAGRAYRDQVKRSRGTLHRAWEERPGYAFAGMAAGTLIPGMGLSGVARTGANVGGRLLRGGAAGAGFGAVAGAGASGDTLNERARGAALGGATGAALGAGSHAILGEAIPTAVNAARRGLRIPPPQTGRMGVAEFARDDIMRTASQNAGLGVRSVEGLGRVMDDAARRDPTLTVAEALGMPGQGRLAFLARAPGKTGQAAEDAFVSRARNASAEVEDTVLGRAPATADDLEQHLAAQWQTKGNELYEPILSAPMTGQSANLFKTRIAPRLEPGNSRFSPALAEAWERAGRLIQEEVSIGRLAPDAAQNLARRAHFAKMALDDMVRDPLAVPSGLRHVTNAQMATIARDFANVLDDGRGAAIIPGYANARGQLADIASARGAVDAGRQAFTRQRFASEEALQRHVAKLSDGELPYFIAGVEDAMSNMVAGAGRDGTRNVAASLLNDRTQARLRAIYGDQADQMIGRLRTIAEKFQFGQRVRPSTGSITSNMAMQAGDWMGSMPSGSIRSNVIKGVWDNTVGKVGQRHRDLMGQIYLTPVSAFGNAQRGLLSRANREASRRQSRTRLNRTKGAYYAGLGGTFYDGENAPE